MTTTDALDPRPGTSPGRTRSPSPSPPSPRVSPILSPNGRAAIANPETDGLAPDPLPRLFARGRLSWTLAVLGVVTLGVVTGVLSARTAVERAPGFDRVRLGVWEARPSEGTTEADPYSAATHARTGRVPLAGGEVLLFLADTDSSGAALDPRCDYRLVGQTAPARLWTLVALDDRLRLVDAGHGRHGLSSRQVLRRPDGTMEITAAARARPGNWLPTARDADGMVLALRLYDTPLTTGTGVANVPMPEIVRETCR